MQLSERANIVCRATAFIAWDESERLALTGPNLEIYQPAMEGADKQRFHHAPSRGPAGNIGRATVSLSKMFRTDNSLAQFSWAEPAAEAADATRAFCVNEFEDSPPPPPRRHQQAPDPSRLKDLHIPYAQQAPKKLRAPLIRNSTPPGWRDDLLALTSITIPNDLLDLLEQWLLANPSRNAARLELLRDLAATLAKVTGPLLALRTWIEEHLEPGFRLPALGMARNAFETNKP